MLELLLKGKHLFFLHFFTNYCESQGHTWSFFVGPKLKCWPKKRDSVRKFHTTYGLPLENYLSDRANHYQKCTTVRRPLGTTGRVFLGWISTKLELMFLLKDTTQWRRWGSNGVEPAAPRSRIKHSTTEPLRSQKLSDLKSYQYNCIDL